MTRLASSLICLALVATACDRGPTVRIADPDLPAPEFCQGPLWPCGLPGPNYRGADIRFYAWPLGEPEWKGAIVWELEPNGWDVELGRAVYFRYGEGPSGWLEVTPAKPLQPGMVYEYSGLHFVIDGDRIRRISWRKASGVSRR